jgi:sarcosine oxidase subunit gamma
LTLDAAVTSAARRSALNGLTLPSNGQVVVTACGPAARYVLRGGPEIVAGVGAAFGAEPPISPLRAAVAGPRAALWQGPDEWLLIDWDADASLFDKVDAALAGVPHALIDVSHRNCAVDVSGVGAARLLNASVALDLDISAFPVGMVARTLLVKAEVVLWRRGEQQFHLETARSFGRYVAAVLGQSAADQELG